MTGSGTFFARAEWRGRWRGHVVLAAVMAVVVAAVLATVVAASRSERAFTRLRAATHAADVAVFAEPDDLENVRKAVTATEGVAGTSSEAEAFLRPSGREDLYPNYNLFARAPIRASDGARVNAPVIVEGRAVDPDRTDEVVLSEELAANLGVSVGDEMTFESMTEAWRLTAEDGVDPGPPDGPRIRTTVVGLARSPADFDRWAGLVHMSPAFVARYRDDIGMFTRVETRLEEAGPPSHAVESRLREIVGENEVREAEFSAFAESDATADGLATIARALRIVGVVAAVAGAVVVVLAVSRQARTTFREHSALRALGWTRRQFASAAVITFGPAMIVGVATGLALGLVFAPRALVGLAGSVDPEPSRVLVDGAAVLLVGAVAALLGILAAAVSGSWSVRREARRARPAPRLLRLDRPVPLVLGARRALAGEADLGGRTSRGAALVLVIAVSGAIAALVVSASIDRLQTDPVLSGQGTPGGRSVDSAESLALYQDAFPLLKADPRVATLVGLHIAFGTRAAGEELTMLVFDHVRGSLGASVIEGRVPRGSREIGLGPLTTERLGRQVGDRVRLRFESEDELGRRVSRIASYRIVGEVLFPEGDFQPSDHGLALTKGAAARLMDDVERQSVIHTIEFEWADGVDAGRADGELKAAGFRVFSAEEDPALLPPRVTNLGEVEEVPRYLAAFLGLLALVTLGHALATSARRRVRETATLHALGMSRRAGALILVAHAATIVVVGLVVGVPVGLLLGDRIWTLIAEGAHVVVLTIAPEVALGVFVGAMVLLAAVATVGPAWRTARLRPGEILRAE